MHLPIQLLRDVPLPQYSREGDAALDLRAAIDAPLILQPNGRYGIPSGVVVAIPLGHVGFLVPRSGIARKGLTLSNTIGVIDPNYRGEVMMPVVNTGQEAMTINPTDRIMQLVIIPAVTCTIQHVDTLDTTNRGDGRFGSSGTQ